jgi:hypothetical protein
MNKGCFIYSQHTDYELHQTGLVDLEYGMLNHNTMGMEAKSELAHNSLLSYNREL